jgi:hypothetical protein
MNMAFRNLQRDEWIKEQLERPDVPDPFELLMALAKTVSTGGGKQLLADLPKIAAEARGYAATAAADRAALADEREQFEKRHAAAGAELNRARADHDRRSAAREVELAAREKRASELQAKADADAAKADADRAEAKRRLDAVERAVSGAA